jgi:hypothetical protein
MSTDILYPLLIGAGCVALVVVVHLLTRPKPSRADITLPPAPDADRDPAPVATAGELAGWHREHEVAVLAFIDAVDGPGETDAEASDLEAAIEAHPAPDMRAELAAMRSAADAMASAEDRSDGEAAERHRATYREYRGSWLERLWQFPIDVDRIAATRLRDLDD